MIHVTCRLTGGDVISSGTLRSVIEYELPLPFLHVGLLLTDPHDCIVL